MSLSEEFILRHVSDWCNSLAKSHAPFRKIWPKYLFRHERVENAARILASGEILSRKDAGAVGFQDVAPDDIISKDERSHGFVRMYFRPSTPTQYWIEGVKKEPELHSGKHAPVLVMLVFRKETLLQISGASFSNGNMQSDKSMMGATQEFFERIPFEDVFHHGVMSGESKERVKRARCAEALLPSPLPLADHLYAVVCRSSAERAYLLNLLGDKLAPAWRKRIIVGSQAELFCLKWAFVSSVDASSDGVIAKFHARADGLPCRVVLEILRDGKRIFRGGIEAAGLGRPIRAKAELGPGVYNVKVWIDESLAYDARHLLDDLPF